MKENKHQYTLFPKKKGNMSKSTLMCNYHVFLYIGTPKTMITDKNQSR